MDWIKKEYNEFISSASRAVRDVKQGIHLASWHHIILLIVGVIFCIVGMSGQVLSLNQWLAHFPPEVDGWPAGGPVPVLIMASIFISLAYATVLFIWVIRKRPSFAALKNPALWLHSLVAGVCLAANGVFIVFATPHVPEVTQSALLASQIIWTFIFAVVFKVNHGKNYCHLLVVLALLMSIGGIGLGTAATESGGSSHFKDVGIWSLIFALGILPGAIINVIAASFFQKCAYDNKADDPVVVVEEEKQWIQSHPDLAAAIKEQKRQKRINSKTGSIKTDEYGSIGTPIDENKVNRRVAAAALNASRANPATNGVGVRTPLIGKENDDSTRVQIIEPSTNQQPQNKKKRMTENGLYERIDAETGKLLFLVLSSVLMLFIILLLFPLDFTPFIGTNPGNATASVHSLGNGLQCVFNTLQGTTTDDCSFNGLYFVLFGLTFALSNAGQVIVSQFSAPLAAMLSNIASPLTAVILVIFPMLSPQPEEANVVEAVFAVILIVLGSVVFAFWEQMTSQRKREEQPNPYGRSSSDDDDNDDDDDDDFKNEIEQGQNHDQH